ncbi:MAG: UvrD-helicase domain-containing protein [Verrucomicrobiales bacterium]
MKDKILKKNLMILASAGSGKTYQLGNRMIGKIGAQGADPERMVALTFTRKAAGEFADAVLSRLAVAADGKEEELFEELGREFNVQEALQKVVRALPRFQLGTMDGFFSQVVRGFQYELGVTGGKFELLQGPELDSAVADILSEMLIGALEGDDADEFLHAFKRATKGREEREVARLLADFFKDWHGLWKQGRRRVGDALVFGDLPRVEEWEEKKNSFAQSLRKTADHIEWTGNGQEAAYRKLIDDLEAHTVGSGSLSDAGKLFGEVCDWAVIGGPLILKFRKDFTPGPVAEDVFRELFDCLRRCELAAAVSRTRAVLDLVKRYDEECERRLRRRGLLGFDDVKVLMSRWAKDEDSRLARDQIDFRLGARYDHWLLDEFQDTSAAEWLGMKPLLDEAASDEEGSLFIVGDTKQAIYGWRGGDVRLFDHVREMYFSEDEVVPMPDSWRSCEAVLELVNRVCGNREILAELFGDPLAERWPWDHHRAAKGDLTGEARVEVVKGADERYARMVELMRELGVGEKALSCGILVRTNDQLSKVAELLRAEGFDVIEEGSRKPTKDHPVGIALCHLLGWLADPADRLARLVVKMSPLEEVLHVRYDGMDSKAWEELLGEAHELGFSKMIEGLFAEFSANCSPYGKRCAHDVISALAAFDSVGGSVRDALRWVKDLQVPQSPGVAAVQVMTVHKSKGLGFDVVILPELEDVQVPNGGRFKIAQQGNWLLQNPPSWVREGFPALCAAEKSWQDEQRYEALCVLYVALTRAKRGLYVLLPEAKKDRAEPWSSPANLVRRAVGVEFEEDLFRSGSSAWLEEIGERAVREEVGGFELAPPTAMRARSTPSGTKQERVTDGANSPTGKAFGRRVHEIFEQVGWLDEGPLTLPEDEAGKLVAGVLEVPAVRSVFERVGREVEVYREQAVEVIVDGTWQSGILDRLHVYGSGKLVEIVDFKTDAVEKQGDLSERYAPQMRAYTKAMKTIYPDATIRCLIVSTRLAEVIEVE